MHKTVMEIRKHPNVKAQRLNFDCWTASCIWVLEFRPWAQKGLGNRSVTADGQNPA